MFSTYQSQDVTILLKDITGLVTPLGTREREARIQSGVHYSEMLPLEYEPSPAYLAAYHDALGGTPASQRRLWPGRRSRSGRAGEGSAPWSPWPGQGRPSAF